MGKRSEGGQSAARDLYAAIREHFESQTDSSPMPKIIVHIYANLVGMTRALHEAGTVTEENAVRQFVQGFNKCRPSFHFIDAGDDKEAADSKIKGVSDPWPSNRG